MSRICAGCVLFKLYSRLRQTRNACEAISMAQSCLTSYAFGAFDFVMVQIIHDANACIIMFDEEHEKATSIRCQDGP